MLVFVSYILLLRLHFVSMYVIFINALTVLEF